VLRGGAFNNNSNNAVASYRNNNNPNNDNNNFGVRLVVGCHALLYFRGFGFNEPDSLPKMVCDYGCTLAAKEEG
jgi:hypothetical protein